MILAHHCEREDVCFQPARRKLVSLTGKDEESKEGGEVNFDDLTWERGCVFSWCRACELAPPAFFAITITHVESVARALL